MDQPGRTIHATGDELTSRPIKRSSGDSLKNVSASAQTARKRARSITPRVTDRRTYGARNVRA